MRKNGPKPNERTVNMAAAALIKQRKFAESQQLLQGWNSPIGLPSLSSRVRLRHGNDRGADSNRRQRRRRLYHQRDTRNKEIQRQRRREGHQQGTASKSK